MFYKIIKYRNTMQHTDTNYFCRTMEICQDLRLLEDAMYHERIAKDFDNQKDEVAKYVHMFEK